MKSHQAFAHKIYLIKITTFFKFADHSSTVAAFTKNNVSFALYDRVFQLCMCSEIF